MATYYACKTKGPQGLEYISTEPPRRWKPYESWKVTPFEFPSKLNNNNPILLDYYFWWPRRLNKLIFTTRVHINSDAFTKTSNVSSSSSYVPCKELLEYFEHAQIVELEVLPGKIVTEKYLMMSDFKTLNRSLNKLRRDMENKELI